MRLLNYADRLFDTLDSFWEGERSRKISANILVITFLMSLALIHFNHMQILPDPLKSIIPTNHFHAIRLVFTLLLIYEVIGLVFSMVHSVSEAVGKQFEILSLILLRQSFKEFVYFDDPMHWHEITTPVAHIISDSGGALLIFLFLGFYYRLLKHHPITRKPEQQNRFISAKKLLSLILLFIFTCIGAESILSTDPGAHLNDFFTMFYMVLIFSDILLVLISLRYCSTYMVVFRNSGFAVTTILIRLALTAPAYYNVGLGVCAMIFALGLTWAYNVFNKTE